MRKATISIVFIGISNALVTDIAENIPDKEKYDHRHGYHDYDGVPCRPCFAESNLFTTLLKVTSAVWSRARPNESSKINRSMYIWGVLCWYQREGLAITPHSICGVSLLVPALDICFWHNTPDTFNPFYFESFLTDTINCDWCFFPAHG